MVYFLIEHDLLKSCLLLLRLLLVEVRDFFLRGGKKDKEVDLEVCWAWIEKTRELLSFSVSISAGEELVIYARS